MSASKAAAEKEQLLPIPKDLRKFLDRNLQELEKEYTEKNKNYFEFSSKFTVLFNEFLDRLKFQLGSHAIEKVYGKFASPEDHWDDANTILRGLSDYYHSHNKPGAVPYITNDEYQAKIIQLGRRLKEVYQKKRPLIYDEKLSELLF